MENNFERSKANLHAIGSVLSSLTTEELIELAEELKKLEKSALDESTKQRFEKKDFAFDPNVKETIVDLDLTSKIAELSSKKR